ncbi:MAG: dihydrolipoyl dehydrogenase family protein [Maricaulaceae bacterium]
MSKRDIKPDICVIGAGAGGLSVAAGAAMLDRDTGLFEYGEMGGDCLNYGCVPSKAILTAAKEAARPAKLGKLGLTSNGVTPDFPAVMGHVREAIKKIEPNDSQERFEGMGCTVIREKAYFTGPKTVESDTTRVTARRFVLASGAAPFIPPIAGLGESNYLTNETIWGLKELPEHLAIIGGGPIGMELGQAFRRLGSQVTVIEAFQPLGREEPEHAELVIEAIKAEGVEVLSGAKATSVRNTDTGVAIDVAIGAETRTIDASHLLVAVGRAPRVEGLGLEEAGVEYDRRGVKTKATLQTTNKRVYAVGDVTGRAMLTHAAGFHASCVVRHMLFRTPTNVDATPMPAAVYTDPELARVGLTEAEAKEQYGDKIRVARWSFDENDRAIAEKDERGGTKVITDAKGRILGASIVGAAAGDLIQIFGVAMSAKGASIRTLTGYIAPYPTRGEAVKRTASAWYTPIVFGDKTKKLISLLARIP